MPLQTKLSRVPQILLRALEAALFMIGYDLPKPGTWRHSYGNYGIFSATEDAPLQRIRQFLAETGSTAKLFVGA